MPKRRPLKNIRILLPILAGVACAAAPALLAAQSYKVEAVKEAAPQELAAPIRSALSDQALKVSGPHGAYCEIWLRSAIPQAAKPNDGLGISFGQVADGSLIGAVKFDASVIDYRKQPVKPGVYTLRYALQPVDGNHQGVSPYRDFLLLVPAAADTSTDTIEFKPLMALSRKSASTGHPSVWSLLPGDDAPASLPAVNHVEDGDLWVVYFKAPIGSSSAPMGLVVAGHAPEA